MRRFANAEAAEAGRTRIGAGVEGVLELMRRELIDTMRQLGRPTIESIDTDAIRRVRGS